MSYCQFIIDSESNDVKAIRCPRCNLSRQWTRERLPIAVCSPERQAMIEAWKAEQAEKTTRPATVKRSLTPDEQADRTRKAEELKAQRLAEKREKILAYVTEHQPVSAYDTMDRAPCGCKGTAHKIILEMVADGILKIDEKGIMLTVPVA